MSLVEKFYKCILYNVLFLILRKSLKNWIYFITTGLNCGHRTKILILYLLGYLKRGFRVLVLGLKFDTLVEN